MPIRLSKPLGRRLKYYRAFLATTELRLEGVFSPTSLDGQRDMHARMAWRELPLQGREVAAAEPAADSVASAVASPLPSGMVVFDAAAYSSANVQPLQPSSGA